MNVVGVVEFGGPEAFQVIEVPDRHAGPGEVRIRIHAAAVNPTDTYTRNGARAEMLRKDPPPYVPGMDAAGIVDEIGPGTDTELQIGDRVMAIVVPHGSHGAYAEQIVLPAGAVTRAPHGTSHAEASTLPMNGLTARLALDLMALRPGQTLAVTGAAGAFGGYMVQLGKADGLRVIADASEADEPLVRSLGADVVVRRGDDVAERFRAVAPDGVDGLADGSIQGEVLVPAIRNGGVMATVRGWPGPAARGITVHPVWVREYATAHGKLDRLREQAEQGLVTLRVARVLPKEQAGEAHRILEAGGTRGRLVLEL